MNSHAKLEVIRAALKRRSGMSSYKPKGTHRAAHPELPALRKYRNLPRVEGSKRGYWNHEEANPELPKTAQWLHRRAKEDKPECCFKRTARVSPLVKIAQQWNNEMPLLKR